jgi:hypothetical protein
MASVPSRPSAVVCAAVAVCAACAVLAPASAARADDSMAPLHEDPAAAAPPPASERPTRRGGLTVGVEAGFGLASIVGYPNDLTKIGYAGYYTATGARPAGVVEGWVGTAISDWLSFSLGATASSLLASGGDKARSYGGMFHIEAFPLFALGGHLRDLGVRVDAGLGFASVTDATGASLVDSSFGSLIGGGIFYEGIRAWKTAHGPFLMGNYVFTDTALRPAIFIGWRSVLYTRP